MRRWVFNVGNVRETSKIRRLPSRRNPLNQAVLGQDSIPHYHNYTNTYVYGAIC